MAALGLLLLFLGAAVTVVAPEPVLQQRLVLQHPHTEQLLQEEVVPPSLPNILAAGGSVVLPPRAPTVWATTLDGFPPAWPMAATVTHHCRQPPPPPLAPQLPPNAFAHLRRQAAALDAFRPRLDACCHHHNPLSCARHAWKDVLDGFCTDEFGVKTRQFHCCHQRGAARRRCFTQDPDGVAAAAKATAAIVTVWEPTGEPPFPPGEPTAANMDNICGLRELRLGPPGPSSPSGPRGRLNLRLERDYGRCCNNGSLACAHSAWQKGLERFCREEAAVKTRQHQCCQRGGGRARVRCFAAAAPHPAYDRELHNVSLARPGPALLRTLCAPTRLLTDRRPVPELLGAMTTACCPLPPEERSACAQEQLSQGVATLCASPQDAWLDPQGCCSQGEPEQRHCFDTAYLGQVPLGAAVAPPPHGHDE